jgi:hypothetical protein
MRAFKLLEKETELEIQRHPMLPGGVFFTEGASIRDALAPFLPLTIEVNVASKDALPHLFGHLTPFLSQRLVDTIRGYGVQNFELFPVHIFHGSELLTDAYHAFNVIGLVDAADPARSQKDVLMPGGPAYPEVAAYTNLVLSSDKLRGVDLFRLPDDATHLIVSEGLMGHLRVNRPEGGWGLVSETIEVF